MIIFHVLLLYCIVYLRVLCLRLYWLYVDRYCFNAVFQLSGYFSSPFVLINSLTYLLTYLINFPTLFMDPPLRAYGRPGVLNTWRHFSYPWFAYLELCLRPTGSKTGVTECWIRFSTSHFSFRSQTFVPLKSPKTSMADHVYGDAFAPDFYYSCFSKFDIRTTHFLIRVVKRRGNWSQKNRSRFRITHVRKFGFDSRLLKSAPVFGPVF